jgi:hypothetical protein
MFKEKRTCATIGENGNYHTASDLFLPHKGQQGATLNLSQACWKSVLVD